MWTQNVQLSSARLIVICCSQIIIGLHFYLPTGSHNLCGYPGRHVTNKVSALSLSRAAIHVFTLSDVL